MLEGCSGSADGPLPRTGLPPLSSFEVFFKLQMASPRTRRVLAELRPKDGNNVSFKAVAEKQLSPHLCRLLSDSFHVFDNSSSEMFRVRNPQSSMGVCLLRDLDLSGV